MGPAELWGLRTGAVGGVRATFDVGAMEALTIRAEAGWRATGLWSDAPGVPFGMIHQLHVEVGVGVAFR